MDEILEKAQHLRVSFNHRLSHYEPLLIIGGTAGIAYGVYYIGIRIPSDGLLPATKRTLFKLRNRIPFIRSIIRREMDKGTKTIRNHVKKLYAKDGKCSFFTSLPDEAKTAEEIIEKVEEYMSLGLDIPKSGLLSSSVFFAGEDEALKSLNSKVFELSCYSNPLHIDVYPGVCKMEAEIIKMIAALLHGDIDASGTITSCGSESIILAIKSYRDYFKENCGIHDPEILVPITAHQSFNKAAHLLNVRIKLVPIDKNTYSVDMRKMKHMITKNTIMLAGSVPPSAHGCMDDIKSIAELGLKYGIPVHVDACTGGFLVCFMEKAGYPLKSFDFRLPGVTSISLDAHKYGYAPLPSSILMFRTLDLKRHQYFITTDSPCGLYGTQTLLDSRPGSAIASTWATLLYFGLEGYVNMTKKVIEAARHVKYYLRQIEGLKVIGNPELSIIAVESDQIDIYRLLVAMREKGWGMSAQQFPPSIQLCLTHTHTTEGVADKFIEDMREAVGLLLCHSDYEISGLSELYGASQQVVDRSLVKEMIAIYLDTLYDTT